VYDHAPGLCQWKGKRLVMFYIKTVDGETRWMPETQDGVTLFDFEATMLANSWVKP